MVTKPQSFKDSLIWKLANKWRERCRLIAFALRRPVPPFASQFAYQQKVIQHTFSSDQRVLDVGSGGDPFPFATVLADRHLRRSHHRSEEFQSSGKPVVICDIQALPFDDGTFDYVVASHVLEHLSDPIQACRELQRVARAGFIERPTLLKDALFCWAKGMHRWHLMSIADHLFFFEYSERQLRGIGGNAWHDVIFGCSYHPLQESFNANQDLFNVMFEWKDSFDVSVFWLDGRTHRLGTGTDE
ncbi:MAG: methyltransferase domain-containing protein [Acidobacteria bacterium]|nr:methyltransferase domain-containing protein [Acidobacteriota bacterium]MCI0721141.1 methyltransferase domain-containing protein [Acidobacteriota bacterium]